MRTNSRELIDRFLAQRRIAVVGVSRDPKDFSRVLFRELVNRGYDAIPVNPAGGEMDGLGCMASVRDIDRPVQAALLLTGPEQTEQVVRECHERGISMVWMHRGAGTGAVSPLAVGYCESRGMEVVAGECPFMFLSGAGLLHRFHGFLSRLAGHYPA